MDRLRQTLQHIAAQLSVLSMSQRLAIALCAAIVVGSMLWLVQWSTAPRLVPLISRDFTYDELDAAEEALRANSIDHQVHGLRIYVPPAERHNALRLAHAADALPEGSLFDMEDIVNDSNPFQSPEARTYAQTYAKGNELAKIIATSPHVRSASVIINPVTRRRLGGVNDTPTASVTVTLARGREMSQEMVRGFANLVAGAVGGLKPHNVYITDARTLRSYTLPDPENAASFDAFAMVKQREEHYRAKILSKLADIPGAQVAVSVDLDMSKRVTQTSEHDLPQPKVETTTFSEQRAGGGAAEPGVQANLGTAVTAGATGSSQLTEESKTENFEPKLSRTETIEQFPFDTKKVTAAVGIPRSFIVSVFKAKYPDAEEPPADDDPRFQSIQNQQVSRVKESVERIIMARRPDDVQVDVYPDMQWTVDGGVWSKAPSGVVLAGQDPDPTNAVSMIRSYGPQAGLAFLAVMGLFMMMRLVRKSASMVPPPPQIPEPESEGHDEPLTVGPAPIGEAERSEGMLAGKELDPETLRYRELGEEVSKMVQQDPKAAAELILRWVDDSM